MRNGSASLATIVRNGEIVGAGGWMTGLDVAADETLLGRCDTTGAFRLDPGASAWVRELIPGVTIAANEVRTDAGVNVWDAAISWSNSAVRYLDTMGYVLVKKPGASLYTRTTRVRDTTLNGNSSSRMNGKMLAVDPANPAVCFSARSNLAFTTDYGDSWTIIPTSTIPAPTNGGDGPFRQIILFDRSSAVVGGRTQRIYIFVPGSGWYKTENAGGSWALIAGSPTSASHADVHPTTGILISVGANTQADAQAKVWNGTSWTNGIRTEGGGPAEFQCVAFIPGVAGRVYGMQSGGALSISNDNGANWDDYSTPTQTAETVDIPWHKTDGGFRAIGQMVLGPVTGRLYASAGIGCWRINTPLPTDTGFNIPYAWVGISRGIENMVCRALFRAPDGKTAIGMDDKQWMFFSPDQLGRSFSDNYGPVKNVIIRGNTADYAPEDTDFWVVTFQREGDHCAFTEDFGKTFPAENFRPQLRTLTGGNGGGQIVVLSKDIWVAGQFLHESAIAANRVKNTLYITRDRGLTWTELVIGNGNSVTAHWNSNFTRVSMFKDPYTPGRMIFYNAAAVDLPDAADSIACRGIWMIDVNLSSNVAPTVTRLLDTRVWSNTNKDFVDMKLRHGGQANTFLLAGGQNALGAYRGVITGTSLALTELTGTDNLGIGTRFGEVHGISAGKGRNGSTTPTILVAGFRIGVTDTYYDGVDFSRYGLWESADNGATWTRLEQFPVSAPPGVYDGSGMVYNDAITSMHKSGELTVTTGGQGAAHRFEQYKLRAS